MANGGQAQYGGRGTAPFGAERGQFGEIARLSCPIGDAAVQAETEWSRNEGAIQSLLALAFLFAPFAVQADPYRLGQIFFATLFDARPTCILF